MIQLHRINNERVKPIKIPKVEVDKIKGHCVFPEVYSNIFLVARKKSGKTSVIWKILKSCAGRDTHIVLFLQARYCIHSLNYRVVLAND